MLPLPAEIPLNIPAHEHLQRLGEDFPTPPQPRLQRAVARVEDKEKMSIEVTSCDRGRGDFPLRVLIS